MEKEAYNHTTAGDRLAMEGDYEAAAAEYEQAVAIIPDDGEAWAMLGVLYERIGRAEESQPALAKAEEIIAEPVNYLVAVTQAYNAVGAFDQAAATATQALEIDPESPFAYFFRATAYELQGERDLAIRDLELASQYASEQGQDELYVLARSRLGMLLQSGGDILG